MKREVVVAAVLSLLVLGGCARKGPLYTLKVTQKPFSYAVFVDGKEVLQEKVPDGAQSALFFETEKGRQYLTNPVKFEQSETKLDAEYETSDGRRALLKIEPQDHGGFRLLLRFEPSDGVLGVGETLKASPKEHFHGLTERAVSNDDHVPRNPDVKVALDRRGQHVQMLTIGTISIYTPFYLSSAGYGLLVEGTWTGEFDMAKQDPEAVWFRFDGPDLSYHVFPAGTPEKILEAYAKVVGPAFLPPKWAFGPWRWRDEHVNLDTLYDGTPYRGPINSQVYEDVEMMAKLDIPCSVYWIDRPWAKGHWGYEAFEWDSTRFPHAREMIKWLDSRGMKMLVWIAPWVVGDMAREALLNGYFLPSIRMSLLGIKQDGVKLSTPEGVESVHKAMLASVNKLPAKLVARISRDLFDRRISAEDARAVRLARRKFRKFVQGLSPEQLVDLLLKVDGGRVLIDFTNEDAVSWWHGYVAKVLKDGVAGFKLDRSEEIVPWSRDVRASDGRSLAEIHNAYPVQYVRATYDVTKKYRDDDFVLMPRAAYTGSQRYAAFWGGDATNTFLGLRNMVIAVQRNAILGFPVWGSDTGGYAKPTYREVLARWLGFSAFCPIMEVGPTSDRAPWDMPFEPHYDAELIATWRMYAILHDHLKDYSYRYAEEAHKLGHPIVRPLFYEFPDDPHAWDMWDEYFYGDDYLVAPVIEEGAQERDVYLPRGRWIDYWNPTNVVEGPTTVRVSCPLYKTPIYLRQGSKEKIVPLESIYERSLKLAQSPPELGDGSELKF